MSRRRRNKINLKYTQVFIILLLIGYIVGYVLYPTEMDYLFEYDINSHITTETIESGISSNIPDYSGSAYIILDDNIPNFETDLINTNSFEEYSDLDSLGRCGVALANIGTDLMPTESRGTIGSVKPTGWHTIKYDIVDGKYLYNRCHLIGYQLTGENANNKNLITCTRQMNVGAMLDFENEVTNYIKKTNNHVLYRVTPIFEGSNLVAKGVQMEALSVEDNGEGIKFNVFVYNVQNGIEIDYSNGDSKLAN
jgi:DNA-entry nuclease